MPHGVIYTIRKEGLDSDPHSFPILRDAWNRNRSRHSLTVTTFLLRQIEYNITACTLSVTILCNNGNKIILSY